MISRALAPLRTGTLVIAAQIGFNRAETPLLYKGKRHLMTAIGVLLGVLILGSFGAFFLYVPILPVAAAATIMLALILMFILGVQTGGRRVRRKMLPGSCGVRKPPVRVHWHRATAQFCINLQISSQRRMYARLAEFAAKPLALARLNEGESHDPDGFSTHTGR